MLSFIGIILIEFLLYLNVIFWWLFLGLHKDWFYTIDFYIRAYPLISSIANFACVI